MAEGDPEENVWDLVGSAVAERFRLLGGYSPTLIAVAKHGAPRVKVETDSILFDARALTYGLFAAGSPSLSGITYPNAASWFKKWLHDWAGEPLADMAMTGGTPTEPVEKALAANLSVALSISVQDLCARASKIAQATVSRTVFDVRHLFAAMIDKGTIAEQINHLFHLSMTVDDVRDLKQLLVAKIMDAPEAGETRERWEAALGLAGADAPIPPSPGPAGQEIMRFAHDGARRGDDVLETARDVEALAKLICLKGSTPLAAAIFGGWGSGKTTFMEALDEKVEEIAREEARWVGEGASSPFVTRVVQIRFNAWQFVDANLWASLTAEFFDQLRAGGWRRAGTARHAALVERVNSHVHSLTAEAAARRNAAIEINQQVIEAKVARDDAAKAVRGAAGRALSQAAVDTLGELYEAQKGKIRALGLARAGQDPTQGVDAVMEAVRGARSIATQARAVFRIVRKYQLLPAVAGMAVLAVAIGWLLWSRRSGGWDLPAIIAGIGAVGALARALLPALSLVASVGRRGVDIARDLEAADQAAVKELLGREARLRDVTAQAETAAGSADRSDRQLAHYLDPSGPSNPPRLLRYVLEDDPETKAFEKEIGLIGRARRLFQAVDDIIREEDGSGTAPQRIVLYIDDLDRCTEEQVYNVLQAIHLLLAFRSFAVVVGVDVKWIESAIAAEFSAEKLPALSDLDRRQHAVHYLEKIFQVAFWLDPLSVNGNDGGSFARFVRALTHPETPEAAVPAQIPPQSGPPATPPAERATAAEGATESTPASTRVIASTGTASGAGAAAAEGRRMRAAFRTVELEQEEIDFLASPEIAALAGSTPRSVKRLINVYRLMRSRLADGGASLLGSDGKPPDYPLVALTCAIETGQPVEIANAVLSALDRLPEYMAVTVDNPEQEFTTSPPALLSPTFSRYLGVDLGNDSMEVDVKEGEYWEGDVLAIHEKCPGLVRALGRVHQLRGGPVSNSDILRVARLARRFSFNRYQ